MLIPSDEPPTSVDGTVFDPDPAFNKEYASKYVCKKRKRNKYKRIS